MRFANQEEWREWLAAEHAAGPDGVWIEMAKKSSGIESITHPEAVEVALCFGWIDSQRKGVDDQWFSQRFTPRRARSRWSRLMCEKAEELIASGAMQPAGLAEVERAKADGRWDAAYEPPSTATVPGDLRAALDADPAAAGFFESLSGANRYAILHRIAEAKRPETRARRIAKYVAMCAAGEKVHP
ncbi:MAG TPA: YdeI/OmpD-associated family protein [Thermoleophilaceae bacterium]|nr:YdeI/OmpD-associated family protein [Thermoleophilaceae bacterium]